MKKLLSPIFLFAFVLTGCVEDIHVSGDNSNETEITTISAIDSDLFYYYFDKKVYLTQSTDQVFVKFAPDATEEQFQAIAKSNTISQKVGPNRGLNFKKGSDFNTLSLEMPKATDALTSLNAKKEIVSAEYMLEYDGHLSAITDEFLVNIKDGTSRAQLQELADKNNCGVSERDWFGGGVAFVITVPKTSDLNAMQMANLFYETGLFESSAPNFFRFDAFSSSDTHYGDQWNLKNIGQYGSTQGVDINIEEAWTITKGSPSVKIAVIDTGVDLEHPDLKANLLAGYDAIVSAPGGGYVYNSGLGNNVNNSHGTAVAGIIGAIQNDKGIIGVAPGCKIIPIRAGYDGIMGDSWVVGAIDWARTRADVINCSFSHPQSIPLITTAISQAIHQGRGGKGCVVVASSGNDYIGNGGNVRFPASLHGVISVGAVSLNGQRKNRSTPDGETWASNYGEWLNVVAPGVLIPTTDISGAIGYNPYGPLHTHYNGNLRTNDYATDMDYTAWFGGTSAATPHVSGVAALILSKYSEMTSAEVGYVIENSAAKIGGYLYRDGGITHRNGTRNDNVGHGLVDAYAALNRAEYINNPTWVKRPEISSEEDYVPGINWYRFFVTNLSDYGPSGEATFEWTNNDGNPISSGYSFEIRDSSWSGHPSFVHTGNLFIKCRVTYKGVTSPWSFGLTATYTPPTDD